MKEGFGELYTRLYNENIEELEKLRAKSKKETIKIIVLFGLNFFLFFAAPMIGIFVFFVAITILIINALRGGKPNATTEYKSVFKSKVITPLISSVFDNGKYEPLKGWSRYEYMQGEYRDSIDRYSSEDMITATVQGKDGIETVIQFAEVHTEKEHEDSEGRTSYTTIFHGLAGRMPLKKDIATNIFIRKNGSVRSYDKKRVSMDMSEFEKIFDVEAVDKVLAVRILTADVMTEMIDLYNKFKYRFEIHIIKNTIFIRIFTGEVFEPKVFKSSMEYKTVEKYYLVLQAAMKLSTHIYDVINEIEI